MAERISLVEQYDNKDMIVQVKKCLDRTAEAVTVSTEARDTAATSAAEAHTASTNANAASTQAQTAAATVATYETRLGAVENESAGNRSSIQTIDGEITDIYNDLTNVIRKVGDPGQIVYNGLELRGTNRTPDTTVGQLNDLIVNAKRLINELDSYAAMIRTTGNQRKGGQFTVESLITENNGVGIVDIHNRHVVTAVGNVGWYKLMEFDYYGASDIEVDISIIGSGNNRFAKCHATCYYTGTGGVSSCYGYGNGLNTVNTRLREGIRFVYDGSKVYVMCNIAQYEIWDVVVTYNGTSNGRRTNMNQTVRAVTGSKESEPTTSNYVWVSSPTLMTVIS